MCSVDYNIMLHPKFLVIFSQFLIFVHNGYVQDKLFDNNNRVITFTRFDGLCYGKNVPMQIYSQGIKCEGKMLFMTNYTVHSKEDLPEKLRFSIVIYRCRSKENLDSCEEYYKMLHLDYCQAINPDGVMGKNVLNVPFEPKYKCPIKKGTYTASNFTINIAPLLFFNVDGWYWKVTGELFPQKGTRLLACMHFEGYTAAPKSQS